MDVRFQEKITIFGAGYVGQTLYRFLRTNFDVLLLSERSNDSWVKKITYSSKIEGDIYKHLLESKFVFICIGSGSMDWAETHPVEAEIEHVEKLKAIIEAISNLNAKIIYLSTDNVFTGDDVDLGSIRAFSVDDEPNPVTIYGRIKLKAEKCIRGLSNVSILRVPLLISSSKSLRNPLYKYYLDHSRVSAQEIHEDNRQIRYPTFVEDIARYVLSSSYLSELIHFSTDIPYTRYQMSRQIQQALNAKTKLYDDGRYPLPVSNLILAKRTQIRLASNVDFSYVALSQFDTAEKLSLAFGDIIK